MRRISVLSLTLAAFLTQSAFADFIATVKKGNEAYQKKDYKTALEQYRTAEADNPTSPELDYNIGTALIHDGNYEEAVDKLQKALRTQDISVEASAHYNMGNTYFKMGNYQNAIKEYEEALMLNSQDMDAKFNLELSRKKLKDQLKPNPDKNQDQQNKQDQQQQDQQQDKQKQDQTQKDQQQQDQSQQDQQKQENQQQQQQQQAGQQKQMSKEDAERILNALKDDEQDIQKKIKRSVRGGEYNGKDW